MKSADTSQPVKYFEGEITDVKHWERALSEEEVSEEFAKHRVELNKCRLSR